MRTIALLTDFGTSDIYVGVMKGVIQRINASSHLIDLTHDIQPQNIRQGAFALANAYSYFPQETVFLVVVDPGVGSSRLPVAVHTGDYIFVAPDNGVLSYVLAEQPIRHAVSLNNPNYHLYPVSNTFHGRDIFAPSAAYIAAGVELSEIGQAVDELVQIPAPFLQGDARGRALQGEVIHIDHFGNVVTSIGRMQWLAPDQLKLTPAFNSPVAPVIIDAPNVMFTVKRQHVMGVMQGYSTTPVGKALALVGSNGYLELSINQGDFAAQYEVQIGDPVELRL